MNLSNSWIISPTAGGLAHRANKPTRCINLLRVIMKTPVRIASQCNYEAASGDHFWRSSTSVIPGLTPYRVRGRLRNPGFLSGFPLSREWQPWFMRILMQRLGNDSRGRFWIRIFHLATGSFGKAAKIKTRPESLNLPVDLGQERKDVPAKCLRLFHRNKVRTIRNCN